MGAFLSFSYASNVSEQEANASIVQQYAGVCNVSCTNSIIGADLTFINTTIGGNVEVNQTCSTNGQCLFDNTMNATSDVVFFAKNSAGAAPALGILNTSISINESYQSINQAIDQSISQTCNVSTVNQMNDIDIYAQNSVIGGNVSIGQTGTTNGNCQMKSAMTASQYAQGTMDNCAAAGKKSKKLCGAGAGSKGVGTYIMIGVGVLVVIVIIFMVSRYISSRSKANEAAKAKAAQAAKGGVPSSISKVPPTGAGGTPPPAITGPPTVAVTPAVAPAQPIQMIAPPQQAPTVIVLQEGSAMPLPAYQQQPQMQPVFLSPPPQAMSPQVINTAPPVINVSVPSQPQVINVAPPSVRVASSPVNVSIPSAVPQPSVNLSIPSSAGPQVFNVVQPPPPSLVVPPKAGGPSSPALTATVLNKLQSQK